MSKEKRLKDTRIIVNTDVNDVSIIIFNINNLQSGKTIYLHNYLFFSHYLLQLGIVDNTIVSWMEEVNDAVKEDFAFYEKNRRVMSEKKKLQCLGCINYLHANKIKLRF